MKAHWQTYEARDDDGQLIAVIEIVEAVNVTPICPASVIELAADIAGFGVRVRSSQPSAAHLFECAWKIPANGAGSGANGPALLLTDAKYLDQHLHGRGEVGAQRGDLGFKRGDPRLG